MRAGESFQHTVSFASGAPQSPVVWHVEDLGGAQLVDGSLTVPVDAVSVDIEVPAIANTLAVGTLRATRRLVYKYDDTTAIFTYPVEADVPFGASPEGVRQKLGVPEHNLEDKEIDLITAYRSFTRAAAPYNFTPMFGVEDEITELFRHAIEATAALTLLPTMPLRIAQKESSGTDQYTRGRIDWDRIEQSLRNQIEEGLEATGPAPVLPATTGALFMLATVPDRFAGEA